MNDEEVRMVTLKPMRVVAFHGFGSSPEHEAMSKLLAWAEPRGLLAPEKEPRIFGFNNPNPSPGSPNYGYEFWLEVGPEIKIGEEADVKAFAGGEYAVLRCHARPDGSNIPAAWQKLAVWQAGSPYHYPRQRPCLEEMIGPLPTEGDTFTLDLYLPISEDGEEEAPGG